MDAQRAAFAQAMTWLFSELIAQRAEEPVAFLAQLGRDHRKYGVTQRHYDSMQDALYTTLRSHLIDSWDDRLAEAARDARRADHRGDARRGRRREGPAVLRRHGRSSTSGYPATSRWSGCSSISRCSTTPGQYVTVQVPQWPRRWRYLSPAIPADRGGAIEFHIRSVTGGMVSTAIVGETRPGDRWRLSNPHGGMQIDRDGGDVLMVAGSTGLAPLRTLIMDLTRYGVNPRVHLFFGARYPCELYDLHTLWQIASHNPWLSVTPVSEYSTDPPWAADYPDVRAAPRAARAPDRQAARGGDQVRQLGRPADPDLRRARRWSRPPRPR